MQSKIIVNAARAIDTKGGVSNVANALDNEFKKLGYKTELFTLKDSGIPSKTFKNRFFQKLWLFLEVTWATTIGTAILKFKYPKKKYYVICHNDFLYGQMHINHGLHRAMIEQSGKLKAFMRNPIHLFLYLREAFRHKFKIHDTVICFSAQQKTEYLNYFPKQRANVRIIPNGINLERFTPEGNTPEKAEFKISADSKIIIFVGYEFDRKGLQYVIEALKLLPDEWVLLIAGGDNQQIKEYQTKATAQNLDNRVRFLGQRTDVEQLYRLANCFVLPATFEPWGLVAIEAMASGTPVVMTKTGSSSDFIKEHKNGCFCEQNAQSVADKILKCENLSTQYSITEIAATVEHYAWINVAKQYLTELSKDA